jgi:hypothetical protein
MPLDYGVRGKRRSLRGVWLGIAPALAVVGGVLAWNSTSHHRLELAQGWVGDRPGCPTISAAAYAARGYGAHERGIVYDEVTFARQFGHVMCRDVDTRGGAGFLAHPVCQFTGPTAIRVKAGKSEAFFEPGVGQVATVSVDRGQAQCAMGGKFTPLSGPA